MLSYFGGKAKMSEWIYQYVPKDIKTLVEPFSGAMWVYMNTKVDYTHVDTIVYNDINRHMANLYSCMRDPEFLTKLEYELNEGYLHHEFTEKEDIKEFYKAIYYEAKHDTSEGNFLDNPPVNIPDLDAAVKYAFLITSAFNGCYPRAAGCSPLTSNNKPKVSALVNKLNNFKYQKKLKNLTNVHNWDFEKIINQYDAEDTYLYLDPPYEDADNKRLDWYGVGEDDMFGRDSHERLCKMLANTKSKWALSYYYFEELEEWLPRDKYTWIEKDFFRSSASFSDSGAVAGTELLILNYDVSDIEIKELKKKNKPMARKNKLDVVNNVIDKIKLELEEDTLSNIRDLLNGLTVPKLDKYLGADKLEESETKEEIMEKVKKSAEEHVKKATETFKKFDSVTDETIKALKAKEQGKTYVFKDEKIEDTRTFTIDEQIEKKEKAQEPKTVDNNTISVETDSFFEDTEEKEEVPDINKAEGEFVEETRVQSDEDFFGMKEEKNTDSSSGLLEASGLDELEKVETIEEKPVVDDADDDFWNS